MRRIDQSAADRRRARHPGFGRSRNSWIATLRRMSEAWNHLAELPIAISAYELTGHDREFGDFTRPSTVVHLHGEGQEGIGEDVVYDVLDHIAHRDAGPVLDLSARRRSVRRAPCSASWTSSLARRPSATRLDTTGAGPMSRRRSTWPCARTASRSGRRSSAIPSPCALSAQRGCRASTRARSPRPSRSATGLPSTRTSSSSSTPRTTGTRR